MATDAGPSGGAGRDGRARPVGIGIDRHPGADAHPHLGDRGLDGQSGRRHQVQPSGGDSVKNLTLQLPAGLIANASIDGGACLKSATPLPACRVGTGTVSATENSLGGAMLSLPAEFSLVAPPAPADLAGLAVSVKDPLSGTFQQLGTPATVTVRPARIPRASD